MNEKQFKGGVEIKSLFKKLQERISANIPRAIHPYPHSVNIEMSFKTKILDVVLLLCLCVCLFVCFEIVSHFATQAGLKVLFWDNLKLTAVLLSAEIIGICLHAQFLCGIF